MGMGLCVKSGDSYRRLEETEANFLPAGTEIFVWHDMEGYISIKAEVSEAGGFQARKTLGIWKKTGDADGMQVATSVFYVLKPGNMDAEAVLTYRGSEALFVLKEGSCAEAIVPSPAPQPAHRERPKPLDPADEEATWDFFGDTPAHAPAPEPDWEDELVARQRETEAQADELRARLAEQEEEFDRLQALLLDKKAEVRRVRSEMEDAEGVRQELLEANREAMQLIFDKEQAGQRLEQHRRDLDEAEAALAVARGELEEKEALLNKVREDETRMDREIALIQQKIADNEQAMEQAAELLRHSDEELRERIGAMKDRLRGVEEKGQWALEEINAFNLQLEELERIKPEMDRSGVDEKILRLTDLCVEIHGDIKRIRDQVFRQVDERIDG